MVKDEASGKSVTASNQPVPSPPSAGNTCDEHRELGEGWKHHQPVTARSFVLTEPCQGVPQILSAGLGPCVALGCSGMAPGAVPERQSQGTDVGRRLGTATAPARICLHGWRG